MLQKKISEFTSNHAPVLPVIKVDQPEDIIPLAQALQKGGITALEITLRSAAGLEAIKLAKQELPNFCVSAGTVTNTQQIEALADIGLDFIVTPGMTASLLDAAKANQVEILPGVNGSSDVMLGMEYGLEYFKLFPATVVGGIPMLKALGGPFPNVKFCPTGGLTPDNFMDFYSLPNVFAFGGSWMVAGKLIDGKDWGQVEQLSKEAIAKLS